VALCNIFMKRPPLTHVSVLISVPVYKQYLTPVSVKGVPVSVEQFEKINLLTNVHFKDLSLNFIYHTGISIPIP
jgi:hypothetical protein